MPCLHNWLARSSSPPFFHLPSDVHDVLLHVHRGQSPFASSNRPRRSGTSGSTLVPCMCPCVSWCGPCGRRREWRAHSMHVRKITAWHAYSDQRGDYWEPDHVLCTGGQPGRDRCGGHAGTSLVVATWRHVLRSSGAQAPHGVALGALEAPDETLLVLSARSPAVSRWRSPRLCRSPATSRCLRRAGTLVRWSADIDTPH